MITEGMPTPKVYIVNDPAPNAFATGRDPEHALVAATTGLLDLMTDAELEGVMVDELGHVKNYDIRVSMIVYGLVVAVGMLSDVLIRMTIFGRSRNKPRASHCGPGRVNYCSNYCNCGAISRVTPTRVSCGRDGGYDGRHPEALASALHKLSQYGQPMKKQQSSMAHMWFSNPMKSGAMQKLFSTHPHR